MSLLIGKNVVVSVNYTLKDDEGTVIDSSDGTEPLAYLHGAGNIIPGLENALKGKTEGDKLEVRIEPEDGYGEIDPNLMQTVPRAAFEGVDSIESGMVFEAEANDGSMQRVVVKDVDDEKVVVDANHPLAGVTLNFAVEVVSLRDATAEELEHGHAH